MEDYLKEEGEISDEESSPHNHKFRPRRRANLMSPEVLRNRNNNLPHPKNIVPSLLNIDTRPSLSFINQRKTATQVTPSGKGQERKHSSSKLWSNSSLKNTTEQSKVSSEEETDNFAELLQQYKDIQGKLASLRQEEEQLVKNVEQKKGTEPLKPAEEKESVKNNPLTVDLTSSPVLTSGSPIVIDSPSSPVVISSDAASSPLPDQAENYDDEELDELELRRIALASAAEKMLQDEKDDMVEEGNQSQEAENSSKEAVSGSSANQSHAEGKRGKNCGNQNIGRAGTSENKRSRKLPPVNSWDRESRWRKDYHSRLRARTPLVSARRTSLSARTLPFPSSGRRTSASTLERSRSRVESTTERQREAFRPSAVKRTASRESSNKRTSEAADKTREIQKILTLDDPKEQVARFLSLISKEGDQVTESGDSVNGGPPLPANDNYEAVEMDLDSDPESPGVVPMAEELFEPDFYNAMQPMYRTQQSSYEYEPYDPEWSWSTSETGYHSDPMQMTAGHLPVNMVLGSTSIQDPSSQQISVLPLNQTYSQVQSQDLGMSSNFGNLYMQESNSVMGYSAYGLNLGVLAGTMLVTDMLPPPPPPPPPPLPEEPPPNPPLPSDSQPPLPPSGIEFATQFAQGQTSHDIQGNELASSYQLGQIHSHNAHMFSIPANHSDSLERDHSVVHHSKSQFGITQSHLQFVHRSASEPQLLPSQNNVQSYETSLGYSDLTGPGVVYSDAYLSENQFKTSAISQSESYNIFRDRKPVNPRKSEANVQAKATNVTRTNGTIKSKAVAELVEKANKKTKDIKENNKFGSVDAENDTVNNQKGLDEEAVLRAQLLRSLENRKKQKLIESYTKSEIPPSVSRSESSVVSSLSRSQSPSMPSVSVVPKHKKPAQNKVTLGNFPIHRPVIIPLGEDSSEEDEEEEETVAPPGGKPHMVDFLGGLDSFLKEARRDSEVPVSADSTAADRAAEQEEALLALQKRQALLSRARKCEITIQKQNESITRDQAQLKSLVIQASKYLQNVKVSEVKVAQLKEQLAAAETVATANRGALERTKTQARIVKDRLVKKKTLYEEIQSSLEETKAELNKFGIALTTFNGQPTVVITSQGSPLAHDTRNMVTTSSNPIGSVSPLKDLRVVTASGGLSLMADGKSPVKRLVQPSKQSLHMKNVGKGQKQNMSITIKNKPITNVTQNIVELKSKTPTSSDDDASTSKFKTYEDKLKEKLRLQKLALEYETKLKEMKLKQLQAQKRGMLKKVLTPKKSISESTANNEAPSKSVLMLEKIELGSDAIDLTSDEAEVPSTRRKSLLDLNPSTKPNLNLKQGVLRTNIAEENVNKFEITIPEGKAVLKVLKMQKSWIDASLKPVHQRLSLSLGNRLYRDLEGRPQQLASLSAYKSPTSSSASLSHSEAAAWTYKSPLLHFKSYRFSPYFRTKAGRPLSSRSVSHKVLPKVVLCRYDLLGTCNDDKCKGQHQAHYTMNDKEILLDILAYCPALSGATNTMPAKIVTKLMEEYIDRLQKQNQGRLKLDELCLLLISRVNEHAKHVPPHTMFYNMRLFRPKQDETKFIKTADPLAFKDSKQAEVFIQPTPGRPKTEEGGLCEDDCRYFYDSTDCDVTTLEDTVMATPGNPALWLQLANRKLNNSKSSPEKCLDEALNVLARGLEANKTNSALWERYLHLYSRHSDSGDLLDWCQVALHSAPSFNIWWKYLHSLQSYTERNIVCTELVDYLCSVQPAQAPDPFTSHHLLETMLYKAHLSVLAGQAQYARNILQGYFVKSEGKLSCQLSLTIQDRCILWLSHIHLLSWHQLPEALWDPQDCMSGKIVNKENLILPWSSSPVADMSASQQMALLQEAASVCVSKQQAKNPSALKEGLLLYKNMLLLLQTQNKLEEMLAVCRDLLQQDQSLVDVWLTVADLYATNGEGEAVRQVFRDAMEVNPVSAKVFHYAAMSAIREAPDLAASCLENCPQGFFDVEGHAPDPLALYCVLLGQTVPLGFTPPSLKPGITVEFISEHKANLWLNYCLLLELRGDIGHVIEMYETALCTVNGLRNVTKIWKGYLGYQYRQLAKSPQKVTDQRRLNYLLHRCLTTTPVREPLGYWPGTTWLNYSCLGNVVDPYLECLLPEEQVISMERLGHLMPSNVNLVVRLCEEYLKQGDDQRALSLCYPLILDGTNNRHIWKLVTALAVKQRSQFQVMKLFRRAVQANPFDLELWKHFLLNQLALGPSARETIQSILSHCSLLGLNVGELLALIKDSSATGT
ncbi:zinc finger C3H1 domain-containing protein-like isoform X2 [Dreissena polymorpha]|uniref:zinc finger C3H1 domain-containing protein-like isoform X2 n=1 Tax=Dreissena polymorpha TaxID=45954 RepID=UPI002263E508|nr:zinc finger C3H1 domain-containing protein-like isoform X2 [Dreissena polymorpha]